VELATGPVLLGRDRAFGREPAQCVSMNTEVVRSRATVQPLVGLRSLLTPEASDDGIGNAVGKGREQTFEDSLGANGLKWRRAPTRRTGAVCDSYRVRGLALERILPLGGVG
jgi:hypothetical protein